MKDYGTGPRESLGVILVWILLLAGTAAATIIAAFCFSFTAHILVVAAEEGWSAYGVSS